MTQYVKVINNTPQIYSIYKLRRDNPQISFPSQPSNQLLEQYFVFPLYYEDAPQVDEAFYSLKKDVLPKLVNDKWTIGWNIIERSAAESLALLRKTVNDLKRGCINGEITYKNALFNTDDTSQQRITGAALAATLDSSITFNWKTAEDTVVSLNALEIIELAKLLRAYIQECFNIEFNLISQLESCSTIDELKQIDIMNPWIELRNKYNI